MGYTVWSEVSNRFEGEEQLFYHPGLHKPAFSFILHPMLYSIPVSEHDWYLLQCFYNQTSNWLSVG
jgi:hypothetical protein